MKNIHKIIESPTEIMDKCAWWYNTITGETLRWNGTIWEEIDTSGGTSGATINITWSALVNLRDSGQLVPGQSYRITDYVTTTTQTDTQSAGNVFDIIVSP